MSNNLTLPTSKIDIIKRLLANYELYDGNKDYVEYVKACYFLLDSISLLERKLERCKEQRNEALWMYDDTRMEESVKKYDQELEELK